MKYGLNIFGTVYVIIQCPTSASTSSERKAAKTADRLVEVGPRLRLFRPAGCKMCGGLGYKGRMTLHELLGATDETKALILRRAPVDEIRKQAIAEGRTTLMQDGISRVVAGHTDMNQVRAVCP